MPPLGESVLVSAMRQGLPYGVSLRLPLDTSKVTAHGEHLGDRVVQFNVHLTNYYIVIKKTSLVSTVADRREHKELTPSKPPTLLPKGATNTLLPLANAE